MEEEAVDIRGETVAESSGKDVAVQILGPLVFLFLLNVYLGPLLYGRSWTTRIDRLKWSLVGSPQVSPGWLIFGDSSGLMSVKPKELGSHLDGQHLNLARTENCGPVSVEDAWLLSEYLKNNPKPKGICLFYCYHSLQCLLPEWKSTLAKLPLEMACWRRREPKIQVSGNDEVELLLRQASPLLQERSALRSALLNPWASWLEGSNGEFLAPDGFLDSPANVEKVARSAKLHVDEIGRFADRIDPVYLTGLEHLVKLGRQHQFPVVFVSGPLWDQLRYDDTVLRSEARLAQVVDSLAKRYPGVVFRLEVQSRYFSADRMESDVHLSSEAASEFSAALAQAIGQRWKER